MIGFIDKKREERIEIYEYEYKGIVQEMIGRNMVQSDLQIIYTYTLLV